jgi:mannosyltransferase
MDSFFPQGNNAMTNFRRTGIIATEISQKPWFNYLLLFLITLLAAAFRFYKLGAWSFWIDEIYTIQHATAHFSTLKLIFDNIPPWRNWVPVSVISAAQVLHIWGINEWSARLASVLIGILSIPILYFPTRRMFGDRVALIASLLLAVSPWHIFWSQNARFYASLLLFYSLAFIAFHFALEHNKLGYFIAFCAFLYLAVSERMTALFIFPVIAAYIVALWVFRFERPLGLNHKNLLLIGSPVLAGALIEAYSLITNGESRFFGDFNWFFLYRNDDPMRLLGNISFSLGVPLMVLALFSGLFLVLKKDRAGLWLATNAVIPLVVLVAANPFIFTKDRYVFMTLFSWIILAAVGISELLTRVNGIHKWMAVGVLALVLADAGSENLLYYQVNNGNRADWRAAFHLIQVRSQPEDIVVTYWPEVGDFYLEREFVQYEDIDVPTMLNSERQYWFVLDAETIWANPQVKAWLERQAQLIDIRYLRTPDDFYLRIYHFDPEQSSAD